MGYVEWQRDGYLIADGERVLWTPGTRLKLGKGLTSPTAIPLGYELKATGRREASGALVADVLEAKPNGVAAYEREVRQATDEMETAWTTEGAAYDIDERGGRHAIGRIVRSGPQFERVQRILNRLVPSYVRPSSLRVHVVETNAWNARAMANGAIWVYQGILDDLSDDELATVLGHELTHYTHEHIRRLQRNAALLGLANQFAKLAIDRIQNEAKYQAASIGASLAFSAWRNGYSRGMEDQADRVGLRYAYEGGFDVAQAPRMWGRVLQRDGQPDRVSNFLLGDHSRATDRIRNLEREIHLNYTTPATR